MVEPLKLAPKPKVNDTIKQGVIELAEKLLEECRSGEIESFFAILSRNDGSWSERISPTPDRSYLIGKIVIALVGWCGQIAREGED